MVSATDIAMDVYFNGVKVASLDKGLSLAGNAASNLSRL